MKRFLLGLVLLLIALGLILALVLAFPAKGATPERSKVANLVSLTGQLSISEVEGRHPEFTPRNSHTFALIGATPDLQSTLLLWAAEGRWVTIKAKMVEVSVFVMRTLEVHQVTPVHT